MELGRMAAETGDVWIDAQERHQDGVRINVAGIVGVNGVTLAAVLKATIAFDDLNRIYLVHFANLQIRAETDGGGRDIGDRRVAVTKKIDRPDGGGKKLRCTRPTEAALRRKGDELTAAGTRKTIIDRQS
jgi:hypothetical protein